MQCNFLSCTHPLILGGPLHADGHSAKPRHAGPNHPIRAGRYLSRSTSTARKAVSRNVLLSVTYDALAGDGGNFGSIRGGDGGNNFGGNNGW
eukprot:CAMPEP_0196573048 /NCGR_PEP_ID=MMETSP1081-20130531/3013_1 /TAXON_ID=36882 /ORGANISM="Pyramimonas amylifera, Strain CCMP720" /LENGTH=91 /DNA_ID=CAMNT_0041890611 /DNA_START=124 /DNA_END=396 /DNA_ORIENTATION=+